MTRYFFAVTAALFLFISFAQTSHAIELYSKPEFRGRIIDAETKQPIEGAVVVALYYKCPLIGPPGGPSHYVFKAKETLTDSKGEFYLSSYTSLLIVTEGSAAIEFIIFKPGYMSITARTWDTGIAGSRMSLEDYFATDIIGKEGEFTLNGYSRVVNWKGPLGILELKKAKTKEERRLGQASPPYDYTAKELPLLFKAIIEDDSERGIRR